MNRNKLVVMVSLSSMLGCAATSAEPASMGSAENLREARSEDQAAAVHLEDGQQGATSRCSGAMSPAVQDRPCWSRGENDFAAAEAHRRDAAAHRAEAGVKLYVARPDAGLRLEGERRCHRRHSGGVTRCPAHARNPLRRSARRYRAARQLLHRGRASAAAAPHFEAVNAVFQPR